MSMTAFVFARGGSKGLPGKNLRELAGKPLIVWAIEQALAVERIDRVIVSTDSEKIAEVARRHGAQTPFLRPPELASDRSPEMLAWRHAIEFVRQSEASMPDPFVSVPATAPLRLPCDIDRSLDEFERSDADVVLSVCPARSNPWFSMVKRDEAGQISLVNDDNKGGRSSRRQDAPQVYDIVPIAYVVRPDYVMQHSSLFDGRTSVVEVPAERACDVDTMLDFQFAEFLMKQRIRGQR